MTNPTVSTIIVSHNNKDILKDCIESIKNQSYKSKEIILLDNDSTDNTEDLVKIKYPEIKFFNLFGKGPAEKRNIGISKSDSDYMVFMDSDARLTKDWIKISIKYMEKNKDVGICGGLILKNKDTIDAAGGIIAKNCGGTDIGFGEKNKGQYSNFRKVNYLKSASVIIRKKMFEEIGGFDKDYFFGMEDTDLGLRANIYGWKVIYNPDLISYHLSHYTMKKSPQKKELYRDKKNKLTTYIKNFELKTIIKYSPLLFLDFVHTLLFKKNGTQIFKAYIWNLLNLKNTLKKRKTIQIGRKISDKKLFDIMEFPKLIRRQNKKNQYFEFIKNIKRKNLYGITFFITTRCNSKCKHCFYWKELNTKKDLTLKEAEIILSKFQNLESVLLSGGEPFIRKDFPELIDLIIKYTNTKMISIPTNSLLTNKIIKDMTKVLKKHSKVDFAIDCSLDGTQEYHDEIRGVKGNFQKTILLIKKLNKLKKQYPNLKFITANTVITKENQKNLKELIELVKTLNVTDHFFDIMRGEHQGILTLPEKKEFKKINSLRYNARKYYNSKKHKNLLKKIFANLRDRHVIITQMEVLQEKKWKFKCNAGINEVIIDSDGEFRICELTPKIGNLLERTPEELLKSKKAKEIFENIKTHKCDCTHICNLSSAMNHNLKNVFWERIFIDPFKMVKYFKPN